MPLSVGDRLGPYEILAPIGAGGMGEVYRARDTKLKREVALKVLPDSFARDPERMTRFQREAEVLASLNHPNIAAIYGVEERALVMELVPGESLQGPLSLETALNYARQIADALEAAHDKGIIHRDLKPANIMITPQGVVKVLDFGLAAVAQSSDPSNPANSPTLTISPTRAGMILGTAGYMSPEQARGKPVDKRADIWAFGVVLYEMLTGRPLFAGETVSDTLAQVLTKEPDWEQVPAKVRRLLKRCLEKDPKKRLRDIGDAWELLDDAPATTAPSRSRLGMAGWVAAGVVTLIAAALAFVHFREKPTVKEMVRFEIFVPTNTTLVNDSTVVSPDGRKIAFIATGADRKPMIWVRSLDTEEARPLAGTESATNTPFWSPDSRFLAFASEGKLRRIEAAGGPAQTLCDAPTFNGGFWTSDNRILFGSLGPLQIVSAAGGMPTPLTTLDHSRLELGHLAPAMLPDGHHFLYARLSIPLEKGGIYVGSLDAKPEQQSTKRLLPDTTPAVYVPSPLTGDAPGLLLFLRGLTLGSSAAGGTLMAQPFDPKRGELSGEAVPIAEQVAPSFSASPTGVLAFSTAGTQGNTQLTWYDRKGNVLSTAGEIGEYQRLALSPDQTRVAYERGADLWLFEFARGVNTKFTFGNPSQTPAWSADGSRIVFMSIRGNGYSIYQKASNLAGQEELLFQSPEPKGNPQWTHDGKFLMYTALSSDAKQDDLWVLPMGVSAADRKPLAFLRTEFNEADGWFSGDGRWVAYESNQSGKAEIYVLPFDESNPGSPTAGGLHQVSKDGGTDVHWSGNGKELFYLAPDGYLTSVDVNAAGGAFQTGAPQRLFKSPGTGRASWDVSADGKRFLIAAPPASGAPAQASRPYHVVVNWTELMKR
jgi:Tol biopolymer transport system component/predicted Ser/Thr protein kinase